VTQLKTCIQCGLSESSINHLSNSLLEESESALAACFMQAGSTFIGGNAMRKKALQIATHFGVWLSK
jgi:hypothetical protein